MSSVFTPSLLPPLFPDPGSLRGRHLGGRAQVGTQLLTWKAWSRQPGVGLGYLCCGNLEEWELGEGQGGQSRESRALVITLDATWSGEGVSEEGASSRGGTEALTALGPAHSPPPGHAPRLLEHCVHRGS